MRDLIKFLWLGLFLILTACGGGGESTTPATDTAAPVINISGDNPASVVQDTNYTDAGATANDNEDGSVNVSSSGLVDTAIVGTYIITYTASDSAGNTATETRSVDVTVAPARDTTSPEITIKGENPVNIVQGLIYTDAGATASDDKDGTVEVSSSGAVDTSSVGTYMVTYTAADSAGNEAIKTRTVNVTDGGAATLEPNTCVTVVTGEEASEATVLPSIIVEDYYFDSNTIKQSIEDRVELDWFINNYDYSKLYRSCSPDGPYYQVGGNLTLTEYTDTGLASYTWYYYKLRACTLSGCSELTDEIKVVSASANKSTNNDFDSSKPIELDTVYYRTIHGGGTIPSTGTEFFTIDLNNSGVIKIIKEDYTSDHVGCYLYNSSQTQLYRGSCKDLSVVVTPGKYYIKIEGVYSYTSGAYTLKVGLNTSIPRPSNVQFNLSHLTVQGDYVEIRWLAQGDDITHYEIYGSESENGIFTLLEPYFIPSRPYYLGQKPSYIYNYKIKACNQLGCSNFSVNTLKAEG